MLRGLNDAGEDGPRGADTERDRRLGGDAERRGGKLQHKNHTNIPTTK